MEIKLNYSINDEDLDTFVLNLNKYSRHEKKERVKIIIYSIVGPLLLSVLVDKLSPGASTAYYVFVIIIGFLFLYTIGTRGRIKDNKKLIRKRKNRFIGEKEVLLTDNGIKVKTVNGQRKWELENQWQDVEFYTKEEDHFFIYIEKKNIVHHLKTGDNLFKVENFLNNKGIEEKSSVPKV